MTSAIACAASSALQLRCPGTAMMLVRQSLPLSVLLAPTMLAATSWPAKPAPQASPPAAQEQPAQQPALVSAVF
jgi:hypothetical protein